MTVLASMRETVGSGIAVARGRLIAHLGVQSLLDDAPGLLSRREEKAMMIKLITVLHRGAVDLGRQPAGIQQRRGIGAALVARPADVLGGLAAGGALAAADDDAHV